MGLIQLTDRVYCMDFDSATDRPNLGYVRGDKYCLAIDAGNSGSHVAAFYKLLAESGLRQPDFTAITHYHWDHTFGLHSISGTSLTGDRTHCKLSQMKDWTWTLEDMDNRIRQGLDIDFCKQHILKEYASLTDIKVVTGDLVFTDELALDLGGIHCLLTRVPSPHTDDCIAVLVPEESVLFVGDADCGDLNYSNGDYDKARLTAYMTAIEAMDFEHYVTGHAEPTVKAAALGSLAEILSQID